MGKVVDLVRHPKRLARHFHGRKDAGMAIAEYAVGIIAVIAFGIMLVTIVKTPEVREMVMNVIKFVFSVITGIKPE